MATIEVDPNWVARTKRNTPSSQPKIYICKVKLYLLLRGWAIKHSYAIRAHGVCDPMSLSFAFFCFFCRRETQRERLWRKQLPWTSRRTAWLEQGVNNVVTSGVKQSWNTLCFPCGKTWWNNCETTRQNKRWSIWWTIWWTMMWNVCEQILWNTMVEFVFKAVNKPGETLGE